MGKKNTVKRKGKSLLISKLIIGLLLLGGVSILLYPFLCNTWNQYKNDRSIDQYETMMETLSEKDRDHMLKEARAYNREHMVTVITDSFGKNQGAAKVRKDIVYDSLLNPLGDGAMGFLQIPKINVRLVIYHGTSEGVLQQGVGHVHGTSLPVGGRGTHSVLAAHRGLPTAKLFTDLDRMEAGDQFLINVVGKILAYQVDSIRVVKPDELDAVQNDVKDDRVTLLTCTPYGVNSHRLLVSGHRVPYVEDEQPYVDMIRYMLIAVVVTIILFVLTLILLRRKRKNV